MDSFNRRFNIIKKCLERETFNIFSSQLFVKLILNNLKKKYHLILILI